MSQNQKKQKKKEEKGRRKQKEVKKKFCKIANVIIIGEVHILKPLGSKLYMTTSSSENLTLVSRDSSKTHLKKKKVLPVMDPPINCKRGRGVHSLGSCQSPLISHL